MHQAIKRTTLLDSFEMTCFIYVEVHLSLSKSKLFSNLTYANFGNTADRCKNCAERGKDMEFGTNEAFILWIKN